MNNDVGKKSVVQSLSDLSKLNLSGNKKDYIVAVMKVTGVIRLKRQKCWD